MKIKVKHILVALALCSILPICDAQNVVRRSSTTTGVKQGANTPTLRAQTQYGNHTRMDSNAPWSRGIYRQIDLQKKSNRPLYFPEEVIDGQKNLFRLLMELVAGNQIKVYEYLDGREVFNEDNEVQVEEMLERFHILYEVKAGRTAKRNTYIIEESDVPCNEVLSYYVKEHWIFDQQTSSCRPIIEAICPVLHRVGDFGGEAVRYPMFWVKYDDIRTYLSQQYIMTDDMNNARNYTYDDYFALRMFDGEIYKTQNLQNMSIVQLYPTPEAQDSARKVIERQLRNFDKALWVDNQEEEEEVEVADAKVKKEKNVAKAENTQAVKEEPKISTRSSRGSTATKVKETKAKESKPKASKKTSSRTRGGGNAPVHSVRRTR